MAFSAVTERGEAGENTSDTSLAISPSANLTVDKVVFVLAVTDNTATTDGDSTDHTSITDTDGHTWNKVFERTNTAGAAADGLTVSLWWTKVTTQIDTTDSITLTIGTARVAKTLGLWEVTVGAGQTIQLASGGSTFLEDSGNNPAGLTLSGLPSKEYLFVGLHGSEGNQRTWTEDADYTNVFAAEGIISGTGTAALRVCGGAGYRIATLTGDTFDVAGLAALEHELALLAFEEVSAGGATQNLTGSLFTKAPTFFTGAITATRALTGSLFTKAPTFFTGVVSAGYALTGSLFAKAPTFFTGAVTATRALTGVLFTKAPTFPTGAVSLASSPQTVNGVLFVKAPTFPTGVLTATYSLTGTLFVKAPTFFAGTITSGAVTLNGVLFTKAPTFPQGAITTGPVALTGVLFTEAPTFFTGTVTPGAYSLTGVLYVNTPVFFTGTIGQAGTLFGNLYINTPLFFTGTMGQVGGSFWRPNPAGYTLNPAAFVRVGPNDLPPWAIEIHGNTYTNVPAFPVGAVT